MHKGLLALVGGTIAAGLAVLALESRDAGDGAALPVPAGTAAGAPLVDVRVPADFAGAAAEGKAAFAANCATCHGEAAAGRKGFGPPLVHPLYEPSHHADMAFRLAMLNGARAHHWRFGDMPAVEGLDEAGIPGIVAYVRALQRENGID